MCLWQFLSTLDFRNFDDFWASAGPRNIILDTFGAQLRKSKCNGAKHSPLNSSSTALREVRTFNEFVYVFCTFLWICCPKAEEVRKLSQTHFISSRKASQEDIQIVIWAIRWGVPLTGCVNTWFSKFQWFLGLSWPSERHFRHFRRAAAQKQLTWCEALSFKFL